MAVKHFENSVSDTRDIRTLCVAGVVATKSGEVYTPVVAYPGMLVTPDALTPSSAYGSSVKNPNTWYMVAADNTTPIGEVYVVCPDVASFGAMSSYLTAFGDNKYNLGVETFGVPQPAGEATRCIRLVEFSKYTWFDGWFAAAPASGEIYATINANGLWAPTSTKPQSGLYLEILDTVAATVGAYAAGSTGYYGVIKNAA